MASIAIESDRRAYQVAAMPIRMNEEHRAEICLVTSRSTGRWIIPKGWPMKRLPDPEAARIEAKEEAGVVGIAFPDDVGSYTYWRRTRIDFRLTRVDVYALKVKRQKKRWKERDQRTVRWVSLLEAADLVLEPELSTLMLNLPANVTACDFLGNKASIKF
ncbi:NUDIX hydrolase [Aureimonas phyllosphaerae]|uniref:8-oxo-dGTP pyrophosphatase MutT (NUDIX family) n=1 Tax=Aureimonas phyllosphaerae TaxID=1166078 RepID=A0A7W6BZR0_9HYPH|nr:NUDIX hydrolase [Aureimonas phyllosphaerae]MBB3938173.1 8-oxo-dGTP pyrophosphatase MutT (NUDIX family) [Aureimonas phyllosphaerae]MBB3962201.1 8-oxo-dGTP pyrophosphatase MutT (NUDIX family) [Aureimonas phyllosphaerae]SFF57454.1 8-oxo-dGTP pyrophosphatase MutT, NUDIX family [Aureimonas phyllosphaerae]